MPQLTSPMIQYCETDPLTYPIPGTADAPADKPDDQSIVSWPFNISSTWHSRWPSWQVRWPKYCEIDPLPYPLPGTADAPADKLDDQVL